jgi:sugar phosphate isomerase/epimerase
VHHSTWRRFTIAVAALTILALAQTGHTTEPTASAEDSQATWAPKFYGFCVHTHDAKKRTIPQQAEMLCELGFDGVGYPLWLDENADKNLATLDNAGLELHHAFARISLKPDTPLYDPGVPDAIRKLKGRPVTICVLIQGLPPADPRGVEPAVKALRELGEVAAEVGLRISIYHHTRDWTESLLYALDVVKKVDRPNVGANFNLCHWLMVDGDKDYRPVLRDNADKIFAVTINGAQLGAKTWTNGLIQPLDKGDFDNRELLKTLREIGYRDPIGLMCYGIPGDAREHLERSMNVWKKWQADWRAQ